MYTNINDFTFVLNEETKELYITQYKGKSLEINIAPQYNINGQNYNVTRIENKPVFSNSCKIITIPYTINFLGKNIFQEASSLEKIIVSNDNKKYSSIDGILYNKKQTILIKCPSMNNISKINIPDTVKSIKENAFAHNNFIQEVFMNNNVKSIEAFAFANCKNLSKIQLSDNLTIFNRRIFQCCENLSKINIPEKLEKIAAYAFENTSKIKNFSLNSKISLFGYGVFSNSKLKEFIIEKNCNLKYLNPLVIAYSNLDLLYIDNTIKIDINSFYNSKIKNIYFSNNYDIDKLNLHNFKKIIKSTTINNIYINKFSDEIKDIDEIKNYCKENNINIFFCEELELLENKFDFQQINQIIKGYQKGLLLNNLPSSLSHEIFRDLINIWEKDKQITLELIDKLKSPQSLEELIETNKLISELIKENLKTNIERGER